jgi:hypothetical protein
MNKDKQLNIEEITINEKQNFQVFPNDDDRLKNLGEIFSNESSRKIFTLLLEKELTIMEVSKESGISANLIIHHLRKMISSNIVSVTKETKNSRGRPLRFYRAKSAIVIASKDALNHSKPSKSLRKTLEEFTRFSMIGIAGVFTWIITNSHSALESAFKYPRPILPPYMTPIEPQLGGEVFFSAIVVAGVVAAGLAINYFIPKLIPKRK